MRMLSVCTLALSLGVAVPAGAEESPGTVTEPETGATQDADDPGTSGRDHEYDPGDRPGGYGEDDPVTDHDVDVEEMDKQPPSGYQRDYRGGMDRLGEEGEVYRGGSQAPGDQTPDYEKNLEQDGEQESDWQTGPKPQPGEGRGDYEGLGQPYEPQPPREQKEEEQKPWYRFWE